MATRIQLRRGTAAQWTSANPVLASGEPAVETDTGKRKIGDGVTAWADLPYEFSLADVDSDPSPELVSDERVMSQAASISALGALTPGDGEVIIGGISGPESVPIDEITGAVDAVTSTNVRRIIAAFDEDEVETEDGDLLVLIDTPSYFTDFSDQEVDGFPEGWSMPWVAGSWIVKEDANATGGKVLRGKGVGGNTGRYALKWDDVDEAALASANVEVAYSYRSSEPAPRARAVVRGSGSATLETGYVAGNFDGNPGRFVISEYIAGTADSPSVTGDEMLADTWYTARLRANTEENSVRYKVWKSDDPEPVAWRVVRADPSITAAGWVGLFVYLPGADVDFDWFSARFIGGRAPLEGTP